MRISYYIFIMIAFMGCVSGTSAGSGDHRIVDLSKERTVIKFNVDGPYVFLKKDRIISKSVKIVNNSLKVIEKNYQYGDQMPVIVCESDEMPGVSFEVPLRKSHPTPDCVYDMPEKLFALSDIEGNFEIMIKTLQGNGVIDEEMNWSYGAGHLVLVGDFFDRGSDVTAVLWLLYKLEAEAIAQGGMLHFIIGNHEEMNLRGDMRYVRPKYKVVAKKLNMPYKSLYSQNTVLGNWLRSKNMVEKIGRNLFVHGGISPRVARQNVRLETMNRLGREYYGTEKWRMQEKGGIANLIFSNKGPMWYRGFFGYDLEQEDLDQICGKYGVDHIIVGHTIVNQISTLYNGKVIAIDVKHNVMMESKLANALVFNADNQFFKTDPKGQRSEVGAMNFTSTNNVFDAIRKNNKKGIENFLTKDNDINGYYSNEKFTLLHYAIKQDQLDCVEFLLKKGADPDRFYTDKTALMYAIKMDKMEVIKFLLAKGVDVDAQNYRKKTALFYAAKYGSESIAKMLIDKGANINHNDYKGRSPQEYAIENKNNSVASYLESLQ